MSKQEETRVFLCLGSNLGNRQSNLEKANEMIARNCGPVIQRSGIYESESWGFESENDFLNQCLEISTTLSADELLLELKGIEKYIGRERSGEQYEDRIIDLDIIFYGSLIRETQKLSLPHPRLHKRNFVLVPLAEIAPEFVHPLLNKTVAQLKGICDDEMHVHKIPSS